MALQPVASVASHWHWQQPVRLPKRTPLVLPKATADDIVVAGIVGAATGLIGAAVAGRPWRRRGCISGAASAGDQLFHESLNRELQKLNRGKQRAADREPSLRRRPTRQSGSRSGSFSRGLSGLFRSSRASRVPFVARVLGLACLVPPLVVAVPFGTGFFAQSALLREAVLRPLLPLVQAYYGSRLTPLLMIAALYGLVAKSRSLHPFTRGLGMQASTLMMMQFPVTFILQFFASAPAPVINFATGSVFMFYLYCVALGSVSCLTGKVTRMPLIGDGSLQSLQPRGGFRRSPLSRGG